MSALQYNGPASLVPRPRGNEAMVQLTRYPNRGEVKATHRGEALMIIPVVVGDEPFADACRKLRVVFNHRYKTWNILVRITYSTYFTS